MGKVAPNSNFVEHSTEIIRQSKIKGPLSAHHNLRIKDINISVEYVDFHTERYYISMGTTLNVFSGLKLLCI